MSRTPVPFAVGDIAQLARTLRQQLDGRDSVPSHVEMLNLLAKAGGFRNFQHMKAQRADFVESQAEIVAEAQTVSDADIKRIKQVIRHFDSDGRLVRWPKKFTLRMFCLWVMWSRIPARTVLTEPEINALLLDQHHFEDHALLRRELVDRTFVERSADGRQYKRLEYQPPAEVLELFGQIPRQSATAKNHA